MAKDGVIIGALFVVANVAMLLDLTFLGVACLAVTLGWLMVKLLELMDMMQ